MWLPNNELALVVYMLQAAPQTDAITVSGCQPDVPCLMQAVSLATAHLAHQVLSYIQHSNKPQPCSTRATHLTQMQSQKPKPLSVSARQTLSCASSCQASQSSPGTHVAA